MSVPSYRVFLVDDSPTARLGLRRMIEATGELQVIGEASNGRAALRTIPQAAPDIVLMDISMPGIDGLEATRRLMAEHPVPIVLISELVGKRVRLNFEALEAGALDLLRKPSRSELENPTAQSRLVRRLRILAPIPVVTRRRRTPSGPTDPKPSKRPPGPRPGAASTRPRSPSARSSRLETRSDASLTTLPIEAISIGASTGGPVALSRLLSSLGGRPPVPIAIVQHISTGFIGGLATWLQSASGLPVTVVTQRCRAVPGHVYLAGDDQHLVWEGSFLSLRDEPRDTLHRPSIDVFFKSAAAGARAARQVGVLLTGMGSDGADGLLALHRRGATTLAQDEETSVVFGMPRTAFDCGAVDRLLPIEEIGPFLMRLPVEESSS